MVSYELLRAFVAAASAPSFSAAAAERRVSVSAISQQIRGLEGQLGVPLFERIGRRVRLTDQGKTLADALRGAFAGVDAALEAAAREHGEVRGTLRLGSPRTFGRYWLRPRLPPLLAAHPELTVVVELGVPSVLERRLADGLLDLVILVRPAEHAAIETARIAVETFEAVASPAYLERWGAPQTLADFQAQRYVVFDEDLAMHALWWRAHFGRAPLPERVVCRIASLEEMLALAEAGAAIAVLPDYQIEPAVKRGRVRVLRPETARRRAARATIFLAWRRGVVESARIRAGRQALSN